MNKLRLISIGLTVVGCVLSTAQSFIGSKQQEALIEKKVMEQLRKQGEEA